MSEYKTISEIPYSSERAVIVNVHTLLCTTLAILSTRCYMDMPLLVIDCPLHNESDADAMTSSDLRNNGVEEGSLIYMLGYPMGLVNQYSSLPICRLGCIARIGEAQIQEQHNILVDIQNFPGNSGSPIINRPELISISGTQNLDRSVLVGIVHSYIPYQETLINSQTGKMVEIRSENSGLALVHPVEYIREIIDIIMPLPTR